MSKYLTEEKIHEYVMNYELDEEVSILMNWKEKMTCQMKIRQAKKLITSDGQKIITSFPQIIILITV